MPDILGEELRKTTAAEAADKKTGRLALRFCRQCFRIEDARIVDGRTVVAPNLDFTFADDLAVIGVVNQMCVAYGLNMELNKHKGSWMVAIRRDGDRTSAAATCAANPILRRAVLQAAIDAHSRYVLPYLGDARDGQGRDGEHA